MVTARRMKADDHTARDIAKYLGVSRATLYRYLADEAASAASPDDLTKDVVPYATAHFGVSADPGIR
jgi:AcrR family transcriptional regulator